MIFPKRYFLDKTMKEFCEGGIFVNKANNSGAIVIVAVEDYTGTTTKQHRKLLKTSRRANSNKHELVNGKIKIQKAKLDKWKIHFRLKKMTQKQQSFI